MKSLTSVISKQKAIEFLTRRGKKLTASILTVCLLLTMIPLSAITVFAATADKTLSASELANKLTTSVQFTNVSGYGDVYYVTDAMSELGISEGVVLDTHGGNYIGTSVVDDDLEALITAAGKRVSGTGHMSVLECTMVATGKTLNFNYAFASLEFNQSSTYNDIFALFVSVNGGPFENIAKLDNGKDVTITNLRAGKDGTKLDGGASTSIGSSGTKYDYFTVTGENLISNDSNSSVNGITNIFNAQKQVNIGDTVTLKLAISDVGDTNYNSYVVIEANSLSFLNAGINYSEEHLIKLEPESTYKVTVESNNKEHIIISDENGQAPLAGTDSEGENYNFLGETITIVQINESGVEISEEKELTITSRPEVETPEAPDEIKYEKPSEVSKKELALEGEDLVITPKEGQVYSVDGGKNWLVPESDGKIRVHLGTGLESSVTIVTKILATETAPESLVSSPVTVTRAELLKSFVGISAPNVEITYDGKNHSPNVTTSVEGAEICYSINSNSSYSTQKPVLKNAGEYTVYYRLSKDGYYSYYGSFTYKIKKVTIKASDFSANLNGIMHTGSAIKPAVTSINPLITANDYSVAYQNNVNVGTNTAKIILTGKNNAEGTATIYFSIFKHHTHADESVYENKFTLQSGTVSSGYYYLDTDVSATGNITIPAGETVTLCLNGKTLNLGAYHIENYGTLSICDCQTDENAGKIVSTDSGIYNYGTVYLSGSPTVSDNNTGKGDIYNVGSSAKLYAHANGNTSNAYTGNAITVKIPTAFTNGIVVYGVNDSNYDAFGLAEGSSQTLVRVGENLIVDNTAPTGKITIGENGWLKFWNTVTFGLFFNDYVEIEITAADNFAGVNKIEYLLSSSAISNTNITSATGWTTYTDKVKIEPNAKKFVYAKITDKAGNITYISVRGGIVLYTDSKQDTKSVTYTLTTKQDKDVNVTLNGNTVKSVSLDTTVLILGKDYTVSGGKITLKGTYLDTLSAETHTFTVAYNPMDETYVEADGNQAPATTSFKVVVEKKKIDKPTADITVFTYNGLEQTYTIATSDFYTVSGNKQIIADKHTVTVSIKDEYDGKVTWEDGTTANLKYDFAINKAKVTPPTVNSKVYNGETLTADIIDTTLYTVTANAGGINVDAYDVVLTLKDGDNYKWDAATGVDGDKLTLKFNITEATNEWTVTPDIHDWTYGDTASTPTGSAKFGDVKFAYFDSDKSPISTKPTNAGDYFMKVIVEADGNNYDAIYTDYIAFSVAKKEIGLNWSTPNSFIFDGVAKKPTAIAKGLEEGDLVNVSIVLDSGDNVNVGTFNLKAIGVDNNNYKLPSVVTSGAYTITPRPLVIGDFTAFTDGIVYDGTAKMPQVTSKNILVTDADYEVTYQNNINAGVNTAKIVITGKNNAKGTVEIEFSIEKATPETNFPTWLSIGTDKLLSDIDLTGFEGYTWDNPETKVLYGKNDYSMTFTPADTDNYLTVTEKVTVEGNDITAPTGEIEIAQNKWKEFLSGITFGLFFNETQTVTVAAEDTESGIQKTEYYLAETELDLPAVLSLTEWTLYEDAFSLNPDKNYIVYVKVTDNAGNAAIINSDGVVIDTIEPIFNGIENGKTYHKEVEVTVTDLNLDKVEVNGEEVTVKEGKFTLTASPKAQTVKAFDKAGNVSAEITVTVENEHKFIWGGWYDNIGGTHSKDAHCACGANLRVTEPIVRDVVIERLDKESESQGKDIQLIVETDIEKIGETSIESIKQKLGKGITAEYLDIIIRDVTSSVNIKNTKRVLEIAVKFDFAEKLNISAYRNCSGEVIKLNELTEKPTAIFADSTYYIDYENGFIYFYANKFSTYGIAYHTHTLTKVLRTEPTADGDGNIEYWYCEYCDEYFADSEGEIKIEKAQTVLKYTEPECCCCLWWILILIGLGLIIFFIIIIIKRKDDEEDEEEENPEGENKEN